jgi:acyl carrier protein
MLKEEILKKVELVFRDVFGKESLIINEQMSANDIDEWNSLNHMILVSDIEKVFAIKFKLKDLNKMRNIGDMVEIITMKLEEQK